MEKNIFTGARELYVAAVLERHVKKAEGLLFLDRSVDPLNIGQAFLRNEIVIHNANAEQAAAVLWCLVNGADSYSIDKKGRIKEKVFNS